MIIELTGIPGAGKSTIIESLKNSSEAKEFIFDIQSYLLDRAFLPLKGKIGYELLLLTYIFLLKRRDWYLFKYVFSFVKNSGNSFFHKINILRNTLKKLIIYRYIKNSNKVFFIDEGVSHIPFNVFVDVRKNINNDELKVLLGLLPSIDSLLIVDASDDILLERVIARGREGHRRIDFDSKENIQCFMQQSREVLEALKSHINGYIYQNIDKDIDTKKIMNELGLKNV